MTIEEKIKSEFENKPAEFYQVLTFGELSQGDKYIALPTPGDNSGHGGFKRGSYVFQKTEPLEVGGTKYNSIKNSTMQHSHSPDSMPVIKLI